MFGRKQEPVQWTVTLAWYNTDTFGPQTVDITTVDAEDVEHLYAQGKLEEWVEGVRRIVREELAELVPVDVPDAPPEDLR